jgi:hypothetical protein
MLPPVRRLLAERTIVAIDDVQAYRYRGVQVRGLGRLTAFVVPGSKRSQALGCLRTQGAARVRDCERIVAAARIASAGAALAPSQSFARRLRRAISTLNATRAGRVRAMRLATTPSSQAQAARRIARAYANARRRVGALPATPTTSRPIDGLRAELRTASKAYTALAAAAVTSSTRAYDAQRQRARSSERRVQEALRSFSRLGYAVP